MKTVFTFCLIFSCLYLFSQTVVTTLPQERNTVLEEYTGMKCGYCPNGHYLANMLASDNPGRVVLINIHHGVYSTPSSTYPYDFRTTWGAALVANAGVTGYPSGTVNRQIFPDIASGLVLDRGNWSVAAAKVFPERSPVNIAFWSNINTSTRELTVTVELYYTSSSPQSTNYLNVALLQDNVIGWQTDYASPAYPGGNTHNYVHNHILRHLITGQWGDTINTTTQGSVITRTYTYIIPDTIPANAYSTDIILSNCKLAVFVSESHNLIYTGFSAALGATINGETNVYTGDLNGISAQAQTGQTGVTGSDHIYEASNALNSQGDYMFVMTSTAPGDWNYNFSNGANVYTDTAYISIDALDTAEIVLNVTPGTSPKFACFTLTMSSVDYPASSPKVFDYYVMSGITDLIVNGSGGWGDGLSHNFTQKYIDGLTFAGNTHFDVIPGSIMQKASESNILDDVNNLYLNIAWTFPSFSDDEAIALMAFMDNGGNVLVAGQDVGWDIMSGSGSGNTVTQTLYTNYFNVTYNADGTSATTQFIPAGEHIFKICGASTIIDAYSGYMYPDEISPRTGALAIYNYDAGGTKTGGIRYNNGTYKVVYLGIGLEMISSAAVSNNIMKRAHDWFYGLILDAEMTLIENATCYGNCDGSITVSQTGGLNTPAFEWSNSGNTNTISALCAGVFSVTVSDIADTLVLTTTITQPPASLISSTYYTNASCSSCSDGSAWVTVTGQSGYYSFLWNDAGNTTNDTLSNMLPGTYIVTVTDINCGTTVTDTVIIGDIVLSEITALQQITVYPNPVNDKLFIIIPDNSTDIIEIADLSGRNLASYPTNSNNITIDVSSLESGMYIVNLRSKKSKTTVRIQIIH